MVRRGATLAVVPDIWEAASATRRAARAAGGRQAEQFDLHPRHIRTAIDFAATHREVIE
jgi:hypothetical protein